jgi:hypothetical protein
MSGCWLDNWNFIPGIGRDLTQPLSDSLWKTHNLITHRYGVFFREKMAKYEDDYLFPYLDRCQCPVTSVAQFLGTGTNVRFRCLLFQLFKVFSCTRVRRKQYNHYIWEQGYQASWYNRVIRFHFMFPISLKISVYYFRQLQCKNYSTLISATTGEEILVNIFGDKIAHYKLLNVIRFL